ncbi:uncharacterized protein [Euwallacea fornicatus]|uniref:uncharacterized protein n=1 Tax=Euwallacea fornicatus TaxID=995702 RepID=UPI0033904DB5
MDEFLNINWRLNVLSTFDPENAFISEEVIAGSFVYKAFEDNSLFVPKKKVQKLNKRLSDRIPGASSIGTKKKSVLDHWAHEICLNALEIFKSGKDPSKYSPSEQFSIKIFSQLKPKIVEENSLYQKYAYGDWVRVGSKKFTCKMKALVPYGQLVWEAKWKRLTSYPQFYKELTTINLNFDETESVIDFQCINNVLDLGTVPKFTQPNFKGCCYLVNTLPQGKNKLVNSSLPVSDDKTVQSILESQKHIDIVVSLSGLKCIADTSDLKKRWMIPFVVKTMRVPREDGSTYSKNIVFINKPFSQYDMSCVDLAYIGYKRLIKTNFCKFEAFRYPDPSVSSTNSNNFLNPKGFEMDSPDYDEDVDSNTSHIIHHNASYKLWNIKKTSCQNNLMKSNQKNIEFNVLVRNKLDAVERVENGALQPLILRPKLEHQLKFGARIPSKEELAKDWTSLFFTPFSNLYRVGIATNANEVIYTQKCTMQKIAAEAQTHYQYKPQLSLGILQKVFQELIKLEPGQYLMQHLPKHEAFLAIRKAVVDGEDKQGEVFDLHSESNKVSVNNKPKPWSPIDVNFLLPTFEEAKRMPGMFTPCQKKNRKKFGVNPGKSHTRK